MEKTAMRTELEAAKARLDSIHKAWQNTRGELDQRESKYSSFENHVKQVESELLYAKSTLDAFKQQVAQLLSDGFVKVEPKEDEIREKIQLLMQSSKDRGAVSVELTLVEPFELLCSLADHHESSKPKGTTLQATARTDRPEQRSRRQTTSVRQQFPRDGTSSEIVEHRLHQ